MLRVRSLCVRVFRSLSKAFDKERYAKVEVMISSLVSEAPLTVLAEPGDLRLGFRAGTCGQRLNTSFATICMTQEG
jgi:hypothetical protein